MAAAAAPTAGTTPLWKFLTHRRINLLVVFLPIALVLRFMGANDVLVFVTSALAVLPLAGLIGAATEEAAKYVGAGLGGFLNATFGNAAELIIVVLALQRGLTEVVKASLTGSILGNLLLVLGLAMLVGGWNREKQSFNRVHAGASAGMLILTVVALLMPDIYAETVSPERPAGGAEHHADQRAGLLAMLVGYAASLLFSLKTHRELVSVSHGEEHEPPHLSRRDALILLAGGHCADRVRGRNAGRLDRARGRRHRAIASVRRRDHRGHRRQRRRALLGGHLRPSQPHGAGGWHRGQLGHPDRAAGSADRGSGVDRARPPDATGVQPLRAGRDPVFHAGRRLPDHGRRVQLVRGGLLLAFYAIIAIIFFFVH